MAMDELKACPALEEIQDTQSDHNSFKAGGGPDYDIDAIEDACYECPNRVESALAARVAELEFNLGEYERLIEVLNQLVHPLGGAPTKPVFCDVVVYVRDELRGLCEYAAKLQIGLATAQAENERLRNALEHYKSCCPTCNGNGWHWGGIEVDGNDGKVDCGICRIARAALAPQEPTDAPKEMKS
jgi:hypothetical protein